MEEFFHAGAVEERLKIKFHSPSLLQLAFVHRSFWNEHQEIVSEHNERLEFLGDSVLGLMISNYLFLEHPYLDEGSLSTLRSQLVDAPACAAYVHKLHIAPFLLLGKGEQMNQGKGRDSILADLFESLIGALYLDQGLEVTTQFFFAHFKEEIEQVIAAPHRNWKAELQDFAQKAYGVAPIYQVEEESGPAHKKFFKISVWINEQKWGEGEGSSKKEGQVEAAKNALFNLEKVR